MESISHHIMPLVINSLRGGHTHTHSRTEAIIRNQVRAILPSGLKNGIGIEGQVFAIPILTTTTSA